MLSGPDNIVVSPRGSLVICEDSVVPDSGGQIIAGLTESGQLFRFCQINPRIEGYYGGHVLGLTALTSEWAGACFSSDGQWMFANIYNPGITVGHHRTLAARVYLAPAGSYAKVVSFIPIQG